MSALNIEVFLVDEDTAKDPETVFEDGPGWYAWHCLPGCLPDSEPLIVGTPRAQEADVILEALNFLAPDETVCLCSDCACGVANDDWTSLDFHYSEGESSRRYNAYMETLADWGPVSYLRGLPWAEDQQCDLCDDEGNGEYSIFVINSPL